MVFLDFPGYVGGSCAVTVNVAIIRSSNAPAGAKPNGRFMKLLLNSRLALAMLCTFFGTAVVAAEADLNVNNNAARLTVEIPVDSNNLMFDGSWLHSNNGDAVSVAGHVTGKALSGPGPLKAGIGLRLSYVSYDDVTDEDGVNLGIGGFVRYTFPRYDRFLVGSSLYYAPNVLSFGDTDRFLDFTAWAGYSVIPNADIYAGWRRAEGKFDEAGSRNIDSGWIIGVRARF